MFKNIIFCKQRFTEMQKILMTCWTM